MSILKVYKDSELILEKDISQTGNLTIGRGSDSDILLESHPGISRRHAIIENNEGQLSIRLISNSGYLVYEGKKITEHICTKLQTTISIPPYNFIFELEVAVDREESSQVFSTQVLESLEQQDNNNASVDADFGLVYNDEQIANDSNEFNFTENNTSTKTALGELNTLENFIKVFKNNKFVQEVNIEGNSWLFGRGTKCDFIINSKKSSRSHFNILKIGSSFYVKDLGSSNGTLLNNQQLPSNQEVELKSGDYLELAEYKFIFEIKDKKFDERIKNIALIENAVQNEEEDFTAIRKEAHVVSDDPFKLGTYEGISVNADEKRTKIIRLALMSLIIGIGCVYYFLKDSGKENSTQMASIEQAKKVQEEKMNSAIDKYNLSQRFYNESQFDRCVFELDELIALDEEAAISVGAQELRSQCDVEKERAQRQKDLELQEEKRQEIAVQIKTIVEECKPFVSQGVEALRGCLVEAEAIDPSNSDIAMLYDEAENVDLENARLSEERKEYLKRVARGKNLYNKAKELNEYGDWKRAIKAFNTFLNSRYPDPSNLKKKAKRELASLNLNIGNAIFEALKQARVHLENEEYKEAVLAANGGLKVNRDHDELIKIKGSASKSLKIILRKYYQEGIIEEDYGEIEGAVIKWEKILEQGIEGSEYYSKANLKLKYYKEGFQ